MELSARESQNPPINLFSISHLSFFILFSLELISGIFLSFLYRPASPYETTRQLHESGLKFIQSFHYWSSSILILYGLILVIADLWTGRFDRGSRSIFTAAVLTLLASLGFQLTGNLLPFDRHGVQTATIEAGIAARVPAVGGTVQNLILGGTSFGPNTLNLWFALHLALTLVAIFALGLAWFAKKQLNLKVTWQASLLLTVFTLGTSLCLASPLGTKATTSDYNDFADRASWYTQPLHGSLTMMSKISPSLSWIGAMVIPGLCVAALLLLPWLFSSTPLKIVRSGLVVCFAYFLVASVFFGGGFDRLTGTRDPEIVIADSKGGAPIDAKLAALGRSAFNSNAIGCASCHGVDGLNGKSGPSLVNVYKAHPDTDFYQRYIKNPISVDPNSTMPAFPGLTVAQLEQIAEYLRSPTKR